MPTQDRDGIKVALVVDHRTVGAIIKRTLTAPQFLVHELWTDKEDVLAALQTNPPQLVITRPVLTKMDGMDLCGRLRAMPELRQTRLLMLSSDTSAGARAIGKGAHGFLDLPFGALELLDTIDRLLTRRQCILYVDDSRVQHAVVVPALREEGWEVDQACTGEEAWKILDQGQQVDLVLTDVEMPSGDGFWLCGQIKQDARFRHIPVFLATSLDSHESIRKGFAAGADDYLTKPILLPELVSRLHRALSPTDKRRSKRILVVDDAQVVREMVARLLEAHGFDVVGAADGVEALEVLSSRDIQLVISDHDMPHVNGIELCRAIRTDESVRTLPFIMMSGVVSEADAVKVRSAGVNTFIRKPFTSDRMLVEVERALAHTMLAQQRQAMRHYLSSDALAAVDRQARSGTGEMNRASDQHRTILFTDIVGFTSMCERLAAREMVDLLNIYFERMVEIAVRWGASVDKFIGDALMVLFDEEAQGACRAVCAGLEMLNVLPEISREVGQELHIRVGINSGHVVQGDIGSRLHRRDFTVIGDSVNLAQRLEGAAGRDQIYISQPTHDLVAEWVEVVPTRLLKVKGKEQPVQAYRIVGVADSLRKDFDPVEGRRRP